MRPPCASQVGVGATLGGLRTGSTKSVGILLQAGTDGQDSSEVAADADVKGGVVMYCRVTSQISDMGKRLERKSIHIHANQWPSRQRITASLRHTTM